MRHQINPNEHGPRGQAMAEAVQSCVHCGFCLAACPTYHLLGEEMDSPRGRIYLMKNVLEGTLEAEEASPYIDRCLGCMGCVPACPSGVQYGDLLTSYRAILEADRKRPFIDHLTRRLIAETLPYPNRFRLAAQTGKLGQLAQGILPEKIGAMVGLLPETMPKAQTLPSFSPAQGERRGKVALLTGCVQQVLAPTINVATLAVLTANGFDVVIPSGQGCCGSILMHIGEEGLAKKFARQNISAFPQDIDAIITNAAGCGSGMHEYGLLFKGEADEAAAIQFKNKVQDVTRFLVGMGQRPFPKPQPARQVVYQDACHLAHAQGIVAEPRQLLQQIPNLTLVEVGDGELCCGSAGTYNLEQPEIARALGQRKAEHILAAGGEMVVSGNIGCLTQMRTHLKALGREMPIIHTVELLAEAYRITYFDNLDKLSK